MTIPAQTNPEDYAYSGTTTFTASYKASLTSCAIFYTCVAPASGVDWCSEGTLDSATGKWTFDTSTLAVAPDKITHPLGTHQITVAGEASGLPSSS